MGRGKRNARHLRAVAGAADAGRWGMQSAAGEKAVSALLERIDLSLEPDVDLAELSAELEQGLALIASYHPEAHSPAVDERVRLEVRQWLAEMGIGDDPQPV